MTITIDLPTRQYERLAELARNQGLSADEFARRELAELLNRDAAVKAASEFVLRKNAELYRRLAK